MKKRNVYIFSFIGILVIVVAFALFLIFPKSNVQKNTKEIKRDLTKLLEKDFVKESMTQKEIEQELGIPISNQIFVLGKDSYIMKRPEANLVKKYHLEDYENRQEKYAKRIQEEFLREFEYFFNDPKTDAGIVTHSISIITFYYGLYSADLNELVTWAMTKKGYDDYHVEQSEKLQAEVYKLKVLAMEVLDDNFQLYRNVNREVTQVEIIYENGKPQSEDELFSLLCNINGLTYPNANFNNPKNRKLQQERLKLYQQALQNKF